MTLRSLTSLTAALLLTQSVALAEQSFVSSENKTVLLELYTSEGCSSCPPADRWLTDLKKDARLWSDFIPIAFHVDYWDYIGWKDRFASREFSDRQRTYAAQGGARVVYTPGFFRDGEDWREWRRDDTVRSNDEPAGKLTVVVTDNSATVTFASDPEGENLTAHVAVVGMNLKTNVGAGENRGRQLTHDFVALGVSSKRMHRTEMGYGTSLTLPAAIEQSEEKAIVAWVSAGHRQAPVQAVGGLIN